MGVRGGEGIGVRGGWDRGGGRGSGEVRRNITK